MTSTAHLLRTNQKPMTKLAFLAPNILAIEGEDGSFAAVAEMVSADDTHRAIGRTIARSVNANAKLLECLTLVLKGLRSGAIKSQPILVGMDDPEATEIEMKPLAAIIETALK